MLRARYERVASPTKRQTRRQDAARRGTSLTMSAARNGESAVAHGAATRPSAVGP